MIVLLLLLAALAAGLHAARRCAPLLVASSEPLERAAATGLCAAVLLTVGPRLLGLARVCTLPSLLALLAGAALVAELLHRLATSRTRGVVTPPVALDGTTKAILPAALVAAAALGLSALAAWWLPVWQWDSLGYHLPFVNMVVQDGGDHRVPFDAPYLGTYPKLVEWWFVALRLLLPDDRLVDAGQIPLGVLGGVAIAALARRVGAGSGLAVSAGLLWLALPAVFLQLPTNYVDVGAAAFFLLAVLYIAGPRPPEPLPAALALGLLLGSKPSAPVPAALLLLLLAVRLHRHGRPLAIAPVGLLCLAIGGESYLANLWWHGNPIWPVRVHLGPIDLPGTTVVEDLLASGAGAPRLHGSLLARLLGGWIALAPPPAFDMRVGGFGPLFLLVALPATLLALAQGKGRALVVPLLAALAGPDPAIARYTLAFPALCLAIGAAGRLPWRIPRAYGWAGAIAAGAGLVLAVPGLTGEGPPLAAYAARTPAERDGLVGVDGSPARWIALRDAVAPGEAIVVERMVELTYRLWRADAKNRVLLLEATVDPAGDPRAWERRMDEERVRAVVVRRGSPLERYVAARSARYPAAFACVDDACRVYRVAAQPDAEPLAVDPEDAGR